MRSGWQAMWALALGAGILSGVPAMAQDDDDDAVEIRRVPPLIRQAAAKAAPGSRMVKAYVEDDDGQTVYDLVGKDQGGRAIEVEVTDRGRVLAVETQVSMRDVPRIVVEALKKRKVRGVRFTKVEEVTRNGRLISYEFEGENADGDEVEVNVTPDGETITVEVEDDDD